MEEVKGLLKEITWWGLSFVLLSTYYEIRDGENM